jgi:1-pyrroline-5-carboxylate dehydrogenase
MSAHVPIPNPVNEPVGSYAPGTPERAALQAELAVQSRTTVDVPLVIGGEHVMAGKARPMVMPHRHAHVLGHYHQADMAHLQRAIKAAVAAQKDWAATRWEDRAAVFLRAAELLAGPWRQRVNAATILNQSKTAHQAEIDAACELIDFFRFNVAFADRLQQDQPLSGKSTWNRMEYRPLEGFVYAVTPFNFTSIAGNLPTAPALMGNVVLWKPSSSAIRSAWEIMKLLEAAGLPPGVINFVPGDAMAVTEAALSSPDFAGMHFTGSTDVFQGLWKTAGERIASYKTYPRLVGETGGKNFIVAHTSADPKALVTAIVRGGYEYQGQKCSAVSRVYVPQSLWNVIKPDLLDQIASIPMGDVADFKNFMGAVIARHGYEKIKAYIDNARASQDAAILVGGECDDREGWFIRPTLIQAKDPQYTTMCEEIFGPVVTLYVYPDNQWHETLALVDRTSPYALTGAVFADDRGAVREVMDALRFAAGNFYVNDKPTGAIVGRQPFGGARGSGTNDKAGSMLNLVRWVSARAIKENFVPPTEWRYPYMG